MNAAEQWPEAAPADGSAEQLQWQLRACAHLCDVVAAQVAALAAHDRPRASELQLERLLAEQALRAAGADREPHSPGDPVAEIARVLQHALDCLDGRSEEEQRVRDWMEMLQHSSLPLLGRMAGRPVRAPRLA
jgi:hypothetical protein